MHKYAGYFYHNFHVLYGTTGDDDWPGGGGRRALLGPLSPSGEHSAGELGQSVALVRIHAEPESGREEAQVEHLSHGLHRVCQQTVRSH